MATAAPAIDRMDGGVALRCRMVLGDEQRCCAQNELKILASPQFILGRSGCQSGARELRN